MFGILRKLSGESASGSKEQETDLSLSDTDVKKGKRNRSGPASSDENANQDSKRKRLVRSKVRDASASSDCVREEGELDTSGDEDDDPGTDEPTHDIHVSKEMPPSTNTSESTAKSLPQETPEWGLKLFKLIQNEFRNVSMAIGTAQTRASSNTKSVKKIEKKLEKVESRNKQLEVENENLKEKLLDLEFRQRRNNLIFEGITDADESDVQTINKLRSTLMNVPGLDLSFKLDKCHRIDGAFKPNKCRRVLCVFNWYIDVQFILRNRKHLPQGIFVNEDFP